MTITIVFLNGRKEKIQISDSCIIDGSFWYPKATKIDCWVHEPGKMPLPDHTEKTAQVKFVKRSNGFFYEVDMICEIIKKCPFCGGEGILQKETIACQYHGEGYPRPYEVELVICKSCGAQSKGFKLKCFADFTTYSVEDFERNEWLRAEEDLKYDEYISERKKEAVQAWNARVNKVNDR